MKNVGVLIELDEKGVLKGTNFGMITAAREAGADALYAIISNGDIEKYKEQLQPYGVSKLITLSAEKDFAHSPDLQAKALIDALKHFDLQCLVGLSSVKGRDLLARAAAFLDAPLVLDCLGFDLTEKTALKSHFSGKTVATIRFTGDHFFCGIRPNAIEPKPAAAPSDAHVETFQSDATDPGILKIEKTISSEKDMVELTEANIIISGGRAMASPENFKILHECAALINAAVGASRAAVDAGYVPHSMQVGQTGKTVSPKVYIACGISGAIQHFAGMKTAKKIVAINWDKDAPIYNKCDYGLPGDLFEVIPALTKAIKEIKSRESES